MKKKKSELKKKSGLKGKHESMSDRVQKRAKERASFGTLGLRLPEGVEIWKPQKNSKTKIDILPYRVTMKGLSYASPGQLWYERSYKKHFDVAGSGKHYVCPETMGKKCPICDHAKDLYRQNTPEAKEQAKSIRPKERQLFNIIDRDNKDKGVQIFEAAYNKVFGEHLDAELADIRQEDPTIDEFSDLKKGRSLRIRWKEQKGNSGNYNAADKIEFIDRKPLPSSLLDETVDLDAALTIPSYEELEAVFNGADGEEEEDEPIKKKKNKKTTPIDDDDDEEEEEEEEEEKEEEEEESDDEEEEEEEEEEEKESDDDEDEEEEEEESDDEEEEEKEEDDDEDEEDDNEDEEEEPVKKKSKKKAKKNKKKKKRKGE